MFWRRKGQVSSISTSLRSEHRKVQSKTIAFKGFLDKLLGCTKPPNDKLSLKDKAKHVANVIQFYTHSRHGDSEEN
jgi:hypothetical protein